jgi:7-carboxy-7-deazaguanine synthase
MDIPKNKTYVMPPGDNREEVTKNLPDLFNFCAEHGFNLTGRDHIIAFDDMKQT